MDDFYPQLNHSYTRIIIMKDLVMQAILKRSRGDDVNDDVHKTYAQAQVARSVTAPHL